jgi:hypothetical protein
MSSRLEWDYFEVMQNACTHDRTEFLTRRDGIDYVRCVICGSVFEAEDLEPVRVTHRRSGDEDDGRARGRA